MPDGTHDAKRRDTLLRLPIGELAAWHLVVTCEGCRHDRYLHVDTLVERFGPDAKLVTLVPRLRCKELKCRRPATRVRLRNRYPAQAGGGPKFDVLLMPRSVY